jgi:hypothetical protein
MIAASCAVPGRRAVHRMHARAIMPLQFTLVIAAIALLYSFPMRRWMSGWGRRGSIASAQWPATGFSRRTRTRGRWPW